MVYTQLPALYRNPDIFICQTWITNSIRMYFLEQYNDIINKRMLIWSVCSRLPYHEGLDDVLMDKDNYLDKFNNAIIENYSLVNVVEGTYLQDNIAYYLYKRI